MHEVRGPGWRRVPVHIFSAVHRRICGHPADFFTARHATCNEASKMKNLTENLMALQNLLDKSVGAVPNLDQRMEALRAQIPDSLLNTFDRFAAREKKAVSIVHRGVCSECHISIAVGILGSLAFGQGVQQCGNCGRFLYLPENEPVFAVEPSAKNKARRSRKEPIRVAVHAVR